MTDQRSEPTRRTMLAGTFAASVGLAVLNTFDISKAAPAAEGGAPRVTPKTPYINNANMEKAAFVAAKPSANVASSRPQSPPLSKMERISSRLAP
jgi:hypothetical protein